ncbi:MAG: HPr family phosphocarrier protein [Gleimia sp.]|jgi:phosphocarrier protein HPr|nr:HPr family phosphocarrier protein [Acidobacteriota bacterium]
MPKQSARVGSEVGLHARPAAVIARKAQEYDAPVFITLGDETVEATSGLMIMTLGAQFGDEVEISSDSEEAVEAIAELVEKALKPL